MAYSNSLVQKSEYASPIGPYFLVARFTSWPLECGPCRIGVMGKKAKLLIFERREVLLVFIFIILVAAASFTMGVKMGQQLSYKRQGIGLEDQKFVRLKSWLEEDADAPLQQAESTGIKAQDSLGAQHQKTLKEKFDQIIEQQKQVSASGETPSTLDRKQAGTTQALADTGKHKLAPSLAQALDSETYKGKWTIQLGSYQDVDEAQRFADGFKARGYRPIINEASIEGRGVWYRVGLGIFVTVPKAREYIGREETLFQGQDYTIVQLQ